MTSTEDPTAPFAAADLLREPHAELRRRALAAGLVASGAMAGDELAALLVQQALDRGERVVGEGVLAVLPEGFGFLRHWHHDLAPSAIDAFVGPGQIRALQLRPGQRLRGHLRGPRGGERCFALVDIDTATLAPPATAPFAARTALVPDRALLLPDAPALCRQLAEHTPWRRGHRVLLRGPERFAAAPCLARLGRWLHDADPSLAVLLCLLDARPEQVAAARELLGVRDVQLAAVEFGAPPAQQTTVAELVEQHAQRLAEQGRDVVLALDSLDALARAHQRSRPTTGVWAQPGLDVQALQVTRRWLATARQLDGGGSLTVLAHASGAGSVGAALLAELGPFANSEVVFAADAAEDHDADDLRLDAAASRTRREAR